MRGKLSDERLKKQSESGVRERTLPTQHQQQQQQRRASSSMQCVPDLLGLLHTHKFQIARTCPGGIHRGRSDAEEVGSCHESGASTAHNNSTTPAIIGDADLPAVHGQSRRSQLALDEIHRIYGIMSPSSDVASSQHPAASSKQGRQAVTLQQKRPSQPTYLVGDGCASVSIPRVRPVDDMDDRRRVSLTPWALSPGPFEPMVRALLSQEAAVL
ncbi:hypothetical protein G7054_g5646 [Neopestalotiopsis clavispora]|nr:hypothetical protein G7054_g5646 [Neopestalotiopsis clavispora]